MGLAPASDVEPILEAFSDGAEAVGTDGKVLYANRRLRRPHLDPTRATAPGDPRTAASMRTFGGDSLEIDDMPESRVLTGETVKSMLVRMRPRGRDHDVILSVNGQPARDPCRRRSSPP